MKTNRVFNSNVKFGIMFVLLITVLGLLIRFGPPVTAEVANTFETIARKTEQHLMYRYSSQRQL